MLPSLRRKIIEPLHSLKMKSPKLKYWQQLEKTQFLTIELLKKMQWERLIKIIQYVYYNNSFYKNRFNAAGIDPSNIKKSEDLWNLPILTKEEIRHNISEMISQGYNPANLLKFKTGGSTGKSLMIYMTEECSEKRNACARRHDRWAGWEVGEPIGAIWGNPRMPKDIKSKVKNWLLNPTIYLDTMHINDESVKQFAKEWQKVKPTLLFGHAHSIYILAQYVKNLLIEEIRPRGIITSSMMLLPNEREVIEEVFGVKVTDRYGCEEVSLIASECEQHEGMHLNIEHLFIEFLKDNGDYAGPGEPGKIIVTDLMNRAMPLIRYQVEDIGIPSEKKCSCGRGLPLMEKVAGRVADFLIKKDGTKVAGISLIENTLTRIPGIDQMQIVQENLDLINLNVVSGIGFSQDKKNQLVSYFEKLFGKETKIALNLIKEIKPERSGKYRFSICNIFPPAH